MPKCYGCKTENDILDEVIGDCRNCHETLIYLEGVLAQAQAGNKTSGITGKHRLWWHYFTNDDVRFFDSLGTLQTRRAIVAETGKYLHVGKTWSWATEQTHC